MGGTPYLHPRAKPKRSRYRVPSAPWNPSNPSNPGAFDGYAVTGTALALRGAPYRNGGADPAGFDCSGFTQYVFGQYGISLPRDVREQYRSGKSVKSEELTAGDLIFFTTTDPGVSHVAIGGSLITWAAFDEQPPLHAALGGAVVLAGIAIGFVRRQRSSGSGAGSGPGAAS